MDILLENECKVKHPIKCQDLRDNIFTRLFF